MAEQHDLAQLVVIGASAGGVETLSALVSSLPTPFPAPLVIAQHLDPRRTSHLGQILGSRSTLPVRTVLEREPLEAGVVYVVPADRHVRMTDGEVAVSADPPGGPKPSIDLLLSSAARIYGEGLIAVILTGSGSDGTAGARDVKAAGGTVVIQDPATASFPAMPQSLAPSSVDVVANLEAIGQILRDLLTGAYPPARPDEDRALGTFLDRLRERSGIDFASHKRPTIRRRLQRRMLATGQGRLRDYVRYVHNEPDEYQRLVSSFLIKVTDFFRDAELFDHLRDRVLPELIAEARKRGNELRIWSAGCATGEEAYSLAILVSELLGDELSRFTVRIFATDLDNEAVNFARRGVYSAAHVSGMPSGLVDRYFTPLDGEYTVKKHVRPLIVFGQHDLGQRAPFPRIDLTLCRNVLIYFTTELQKRTLQLFAFSLREGGYLVLGKAETTSPLAEFFALEEPRLRTYRRQGNRMLLPPLRIRASSPPPLPQLRSPAGRRIPSVPELAGTHAAQDLQRPRSPGERGEAVLLRLPLGVVLVNRSYDILTINREARRLFGIHGTAIGEDFIHLQQGLPPLPLRAAIDTALRGDESGAVPEVEQDEAMFGQGRILQVTCHPYEVGAEQGGVDAALIVASDITDHVQSRREIEQAYRAQHEELERQAIQLRRLRDANRALIEANDELTGSIAELRGSNEELLVAHEEGQAAAEEIETLNEELQATNEELETLNEELQATVEELNTTNDDLQARTTELQELAISLEGQHAASEAERARLEAILTSMADAVMVVDRSGRVLETNAAYDEMFGRSETSFAAEDEAGRPLALERTPQELAARGEAFRMEFTLPRPNGERSWFEAIGRPIGRQEQELGGVVLIRDITDQSLRRLQQQFLAIAGHELRTPLSAMRGYVQLLQRDLERGTTSERTLRHAAVALDQTARMEKLIGDLIDLTRLEAGTLRLNLAPVDLTPLSRRVVELAQSLGPRHEFQLEVDREPIIVNGDAARLECVLLNLLTNAIKYAPDSDRIQIRVRRADDEAEIEVQDFGPGIAPEDLPRIFSRFYQVTRGDGKAQTGLGLGLFISREVVAAHGGRIEANSVLGDGSRFTVRLPLKDS